MLDRNKYILQDTPLKNDLLKFFKRKDKIIIFDVGSCEGEESIRYSRLFPQAKIFAFEPLPANQELINKNIKEYNIKNVELIPFAVSDKVGNSVFYVSSGVPDHERKDLDWDFGNKYSSLLTPNNKNQLSWLKF